MIEAFEKLNNLEVELMLKAPIIVCILIAGADGTIDNKEIEKAIHITKKETKSNAPITATYFTELSQDFEDKLKVLIQSYPYHPKERSAIIIEELCMLNTIWPKLDRDFSKAFYESLKGFAEKIATSSGGLLGINSVGSEEEQYLNLSMIKDPGLA